MRNGIRVALACMTVCAWAGCSNQPGLTSGDAGFVHWIGLDSRPLAVGSRLIVTLEIATDGGTAPSYTVASSNPDVVGVEDGGNERLVLDVRGEGSATLELKAPGERAEISVVASIPVALEIWDAEHQAAGVGNPFDPIFPFDVLMTSEEVLQGVVLDASGRTLNSWGLVQYGDDTLLASKREPEQFILKKELNPSGTFTAYLVDAGVQVTDDAGLPAEDGGLNPNATSSVTYTVNFVASASTVRLLRGGPSELNVLAQALDLNNNEVYGIADWEFSCYPPNSCTVNRLSPSAISLSIQPGTGSHDVFASSSSQALMGMLVIP